MDEQENTGEENTAEAIRQAAAEPLSATVDGQSVTNRSVDELIKADRYAASKKAAKTPRFGIGLSRLNPGSAVGGGQ